jgi:hypothetical protein
MTFGTVPTAFQVLFYKTGTYPCTSFKVFFQTSSEKMGIHSTSGDPGGNGNHKRGTGFI